MTAFSRQGATPLPAPEPDHGPLKWDAFLQRSTSLIHETVNGRPRAGLAGKRVLVTGAGGWIGSALACSIAQSEARELVLLDAAEGPLHEITQTLHEIHGAADHTAILASICDPGAIAELFARHKPQIIFHAGAFKHVPLMETNPFAVVANNALGTHILAEAAAKYGSEQIVMVSTDKAVDPFSLMGASKRIAELVMLAPRQGILRSKAVRLGNVLGSSGSVVPLFRRQIAHGGPVTVSHPDVRRYFMTLTETVEAILYALSSDCAEGLLVPELGTPIRVLDLAKHLIAQNQSSLNGSALKSEVPIVFTSLRPGDKLEESLISTREAYAEEPAGFLRAILSPSPEPAELDAAMAHLRQAVDSRDLCLLLESVLRIVPEYKPSLLLREQISAATGPMVSA